MNCNCATAGFNTVKADLRNYKHNYFCISYILKKKHFLLQNRYISLMIQYKNVANRKYKWELLQFTVNKHYYWPIRQYHLTKNIYI